MKGEKRGREGEMEMGGEKGGLAGEGEKHAAKSGQHYCPVRNERFEPRMKFQETNEGRMSGYNESKQPGGCLLNV